MDSDTSVDDTRRTGLQPVADGFTRVLYRNNPGSSRSQGGEGRKLLPGGDWLLDKRAETYGFPHFQSTRNLRFFPQSSWRVFSLIERERRIIGRLEAVCGRLAAVALGSTAEQPALTAIARHRHLPREPNQNPKPQEYVAARSDRFASSPDAHFACSLP